MVIDTPVRAISRLRKHFAHEMPVNFDEQQGRIGFNAGGQKALTQA